MKVLHVLDHSLPLFSGYSFRSQSIVRFQRALGITPACKKSRPTGSEKDETEEQEGIRHYRTRTPSVARIAPIPFVAEVALMTKLARRLAEVSRTEKLI
jgi:hypothetical protein